MSLLGAYDDSDEEDATEAQPPPVKTQLNQSADIDSTLANFMAVSITLFETSVTGNVHNGREPLTN